MVNISQRIKFIIKYIHQLPQHLLGIFVVIFSRAHFIENYYKTSYNFGVSLGNYIIMNNDLELKHEQGHQKQSLYLGWLYLLVIGVPSILGNLYARIFHKSSKWYYNQPWEKWADKLGNVNRNY